MSVQQPWIVIHRYTMKRRVEILSLALLALSGPPLWAGDVRPARIEEVEIRDRAFYVNRRPFFPLMAWLQDARNFPLLKDCAMNTTAGYSGGSSGTKSVAEYLALVEQAGLYGVMPFDPRLKGGPALLGYIHDDEPDLLHQESDAVGYDIYPIYGWNKPEWLCLGHDATERLVQIAGTRPVYAWIETSKGGQWTGNLDGQKDVKPEHIRAEVWMSICRGATAIGYFTHIWKPHYDQFGVPEQNRRALKQINEQITRLTPAILGQTSPRSALIQSSNGVKLDLLTRQSGDGLYLFGVNYDERVRETVATLQVQGLAPGAAVMVVDEDRALQARDGAFTDTFAPLAVHIYRLAGSALAR